VRIPAEQAALHKLRVSALFKASPMSARDKKLNVWNYIIQTEIKLGTSFIVTKPDRILYVVPGATNEILPMPPAGRGGDRIFSYLHTMYGLTTREDTTKVVYDVLRSYAIAHGTEVELRRFAAFDVKTKTAYLSTYDGYMWKIDGGNDIPRIPSGEDEVFFIDDDGGRPCPVDIGPHGLLIDHLTDVNFATGMGGIGPEAQRKALIVWLFALALPDLMPTKPLLMLEGTQGAGKTAAVQLIQTALMGKTKPLSISRNQEADFGVLLLRAPIALLDNLDTYIDWVADKVCAYATGVDFTKRRLFSDDEEVTIKPQAFIAVASKNPASFRREDVADRCVVLRLDRRDKFKRFAKLVEHTQELRPKLVGEYLYYLNRIVSEIRAGAYDEESEETHRMADFAALARVVGRVLDWTEEEISELMDGLQSERDAFVSEEDPLVELLHQWIGYKPKMGPSNIGREVTSHELFNELNSFAQISNIQWYKSPRQLKQKIRSTHIARDFIVKMHSVDGKTTYQIWRHTDAQLSVVPEETVRLGASDE
jgi:hypothetical protein